MDKPKTILIAGATSMIGQACAHLFQDQKLLLLARDHEKLKTLAQKLTRAPETYIVDITSEQSIQSTISDILTQYEHIDAVIYNAGNLSVGTHRISVR